MIQVIGYAAKEAKAPLTPFSFERRSLLDHDVMIDILYCGICHTDIHQVKNEWGKSTYPMVPGHEIVGIVSQVGSKVTHLKVGDKVGVGCFVDSCRNCHACRQGLEQYCANILTTYNSIEKDGKTPTQGGYSNKIIVDENYILRMPDNLVLENAAPLLCAGITLYSPLIRYGAGPGKNVAIIGLGGLGHIGVKIAHALGADVTLLSHSLKKQQDAKNMGANSFYATSDPKTFEKLEGYFDIIINTVSTNLNLTQYLNLLRLGGTMVIVGAPEKDTQLSAHSLISSRRNLTGSLIGGLRETQEMLDFCSKHNIVCDVELIPIQKVNEAYERILNSDVRYRFVIDLKSLS
ncbi:MAG TPA: NAD(P)-dependent alcohol dehydrogenase [Nitrososphaeraceae archaeon]|nr:NAD(P)-dependent alcohol dehydrogenase [Nitrososphaeraceae archaeon]